MEPITDFHLFLASVALVSLSGVMMPGPVFAVTVAKGYGNKKAGVLIAIGHGAIEFPLIFLLYLGLSELFRSIPVQRTISFLGGLILIYMGFQMFKTRKKASEEPRHSEHASFIAGFVATGANPYFFLWWATVGAALILNASIFGFVGLIAFAVVHWSCDLIWDTFVSVTVFKSRRFWTEKVFNIVFFFCFAVLAIFGLWFILSALLW
ncbi:MAG: LysE family transporter [Candidatus Bathyarchaeales archaeon]